MTFRHLEPDDYHPELGAPFALSVKWPYCEAIVCGPKRFENRSWAPPDTLCTDRIHLHASKTPADGHDLDGPRVRWSPSDGRALDALRGRIIGSVRICGYLKTDEPLAQARVPVAPDWTDVGSREDTAAHVARRAAGDPWAAHEADDGVIWILDRPEIVEEPPPARGNLGTWPTVEGLEAEVERCARCRRPGDRPHEVKFNDSGGFWWEDRGGHWHNQTGGRGNAHGVRHFESDPAKIYQRSNGTSLCEACAPQQPDEPSRMQKEIF